MKSNSAELISILGNENLGTFILAEFDFSSTVYRASLPTDVVWNGNLYVSESELIDYEAPRYSTTVDTEAYKIRVAAQDNTLSDLISQGVIGRKVRLRLGFTVGGVAQLGNDQTLLAYSGMVKSVSKQVEDEDGKFWTLECSSPMADLDSKSPFITSRSGMDQRSETDTSFDEIYEGSEEIDLKWGKK